MTIILHNTSQIAHIHTSHGDTVPGRLWIGKTENGIEVECLITRIAVRRDADATQFENELDETPILHYVSEAIPLRMIL